MAKFYDGRRITVGLIKYFSCCGLTDVRFDCYDDIHFEHGNNCWALLQDMVSFLIRDPSNMSTLSSYSGVVFWGVGMRSSVMTLTFVFPRLNEIIFLGHCCLTLVVRNYGRPSSIRYVLGASRRNTTADIMKLWLPNIKLRCRC